MVGDLGGQGAGRRNRVLAQLGERRGARRVLVGERGYPQPPVAGWQEHDAVVGEAGHYQFGHLLQQFLAIAGGCGQGTSIEQEGEPFLGLGGLVAGGALAQQQVCAFPLGALPGGQVDHEGHPAQRAPMHYGRTDQDRHPVPVAVHVFLVAGPESAVTAELCQRVPVPAGPLRRGQ
jgi:hypothetical protein